MASSGALWAFLSFLTRARASTKTLQPDTLAGARQQRRLAKVSDSRPYADPGLSPSSQLAVTAERSAKDPNGRALSPQCRRPRIIQREFAIPAALHQGVWSCHNLVSLVMHSRRGVLGPWRVRLHLHGPSRLRHEGALQPASREAEGHLPVPTDEDFVAYRLVPNSARRD